MKNYIIPNRTSDNEATLVYLRMERLRLQLLDCTRHPRTGEIMTFVGVYDDLNKMSQKLHGKTVSVEDDMHNRKIPLYRTDWTIPLLDAEIRKHEDILSRQI